MKQYLFLYENKLRITNFIISKNYCPYFKQNLGIEIQTAHEPIVADFLDLFMAITKMERAKKRNINEIDDKNQESLTQKLI